MEEKHPTKGWEIWIKKCGINSRRIENSFAEGTTAMAAAVISVG